jgi:hypothetical protein
MLIKSGLPEMVRQVSAGAPFCYPNQPAIGISVPSGTDDWGDWVEFEDVVDGDIFVEKIIIDPSSLTTANYLTVQIGVGAETFEEAIWEEPIVIVQATSQGAGADLKELVPVASGSRLVVRTGANVVASPKITLQVQRQSNVAVL